MSVLLSSYFKRIDFDSTNGNLIIYKMRLDGNQLLGDATVTQSLLRKNIGGTNATLLLEVSIVSTLAGDAYHLTISDATEISECYYLRAPFGYIDSTNGSAANLHEMYFGEFVAEKVVVMKRVVEPTPTTPEASGYIVNNTSFGMMAAVAGIGETDLRNGRKAPSMVLMTDRKLYLALDEYKNVGSNTYYNLILQQEN